MDWLHSFTDGLLVALTLGNAVVIGVRIGWETGLSCGRLDADLERHKK